MAQLPKILNLNAPTVRNQRTLIWLQNQDTTVNWSKWDGVVTSLDAFTHWSNKAKIVGIILTEPSGESFLEKLFEVSKKVPIILLSQKILALKSQAYWSDNYDNILNIDGILDQYPFIETPWDGSPQDAIAILALLCRYNRIVDSELSTTRSTMITPYITLEHNIKPNQVWMITQFFKHKDNKRYREIKECLIKNCECPFIDKIVLINEKDYSNEFSSITGSHKIQQIISGRRLTYADFIKYTYDNIPNDVYVILCNADIYFGDSLNDLWKIDMNDRVLSLLRWDVDPSGRSNIFGPRADSQDSWIFLSNSIKSRTWDYSKFSFQLGQAGCDNAFAGQIMRQRFIQSNPALTFKTFHLHNTNIRNYNKSDFIRSDIYVNLAPCYIIDMRQEISPKNGIKTKLNNEVVSFEVKSSSMSNEITYCTMLEKEGRFKWEASIENFYFDASIPIYSWNNACVTPNGLVYDLYAIYKGHHSEEPRFNYWKNSNVDILTPLQKRSKMLAIPFNDTTVFKHPDTYILNYISRCARLLKQYPDASFWIPKAFAEYLEYFSWNVSQLNGVYFDENTGCWADEVIGFLPRPNELGSEDIAALRELLPQWIEKPAQKVCAVVISGPITQEFIDKRLSEFLLGSSEEWSIRYVYESDYASYDSLLGASLCIFVGGQKTTTSWAKLWALPVGCRVIEFQQELKIDGEFQHLAHICGFKPWVLLLSKGSVQDVQEQIIEQLTRWFKKNDDEV